LSWVTLNEKISNDFYWYVKCEKDYDGPDKIDAIKWQYQKLYDEFNLKLQKENPHASEIILQSEILRTKLSEISQDVNSLAEFGWKKDYL